MMHAPNDHRVRNGPLASDDSYGCNGAFLVPLHGRALAIIASDGRDWEHVSVHVMLCRKMNRDHRIESQPERTPTWEEMCIAKSLFWTDEDCVMQLHPPKSQYVNQHKHTLHLWRPKIGLIPQPPRIFV